MSDAPWLDRYFGPADTEGWRTCLTCGDPTPMPRTHLANRHADPVPVASTPNREER